MAAFFVGVGLLVLASVVHSATPTHDALREKRSIGPACPDGGKKSGQQPFGRRIEIDTRAF